MDVSPWWVAVGFGGQALFSARFIIQWLASEKARRSIVPRAFWWFSLVGGMTLLAYAIHREDPVFIAGQGAGLFIYLRNLSLIKRDRQSLTSPGSEASSRAPQAATVVEHACGKTEDRESGTDDSLKARLASLEIENARLKTEVAHLHANPVQHQGTGA
ncbi:lipid-A-disaccharide synthase N-terminal domain-containing protein [Cobetia sp. cqz5-12]|uniref:lipid-A-disaccharide synthase N-terminal domain-containing protein n=1 Tax=Cobetia sp. cqz5-12 TaxID=2609415 RepID=UPI001F4157F4|nr:lipid-A-disaccharide synthase N-terminal domain-containing protein [Cobetia sp. cqz5-12]